MIEKQINKEYVLAKIKDYNVENYPKKLNAIINRLDSIVRSRGFMDEMSRFIPIDVQERTLKKEKFLEFLVNEVKELLLEVKRYCEE